MRRLSRRKSMRLLRKPSRRPSKTLLPRHLKLKFPFKLPTKTTSLSLSSHLPLRLSRIPKKSRRPKKTQRSSPPNLL